MRSHVVLHEWLSFYSAFFLFFSLNIHQSGVLTALAWLVPHKTAAVSAQVLCTPYNHAPCHFMQSHIRKVYACLAVTCHLHFWQNDRDLLRATVVTWGWNGYRNKSQHRKSTLEKKILPPLQQGFKPATFQPRVWHSNHWAIPAPDMSYSITYFWNSYYQKHFNDDTSDDLHGSIFPTSGIPVSSTAMKTRVITSTTASSCTSGTPVSTVM